MRVCEKMPARGSGIKVCYFFKIFSETNKNHLSFLATDEETNFSAAFCRSFLRRRAHAATQKRCSEIHFSQAVMPAKN